MVGGQQIFQHGELLGRQRQPYPGSGGDPAGRIETQIGIREQGGHDLLGAATYSDVAERYENLFSAIYNVILGI